MLKNKKLAVLLCLAIVVIVSVAASSPPQDKPPKRNLKVLPKDISHDDLDKVMDNFKAALGVKCDFCHAKRKDDPQKLDFASDEKPEKNITRDMMRMTGKINKKFFHYSAAKANGALPPISCVTCHNGKAHPENKKS